MTWIDEHFLRSPFNKKWFPAGVQGIFGDVQECYVHGPISPDQRRVKVTYFNRESRLLDEVLVKSLVPSRRILQNANFSSAPVRCSSSTLTVAEFFQKAIGNTFTLEELNAALGRDCSGELGCLEPCGKKRCAITAETKKCYRLRYGMDIKDIGTLEELEATYKKCQACELGREARERGIVECIVGRGSRKPKLVIIGEAPGRQEEETGVVFFPEAPAGRFLHLVMQRVELDPDDVYITNAVCSRPLPEDPSSTAENGKPTEEHIKECRKRLKALLFLTRPKVVVLLGAYAYLSYYGEAPKSVRSVLGWHNTDNPKVYCHYHPAYLVRQGKNKSLIKECVEGWREVSNYIRGV